MCCWHPTVGTFIREILGADLPRPAFRWHKKKKRASKMKRKEKDGNMRK
jgi:hypothetical protein